jgi:hypothetical protein
LSQSQLAERSWRSQQWLSEVERGQLGAPLRAIEDVLAAVGCRLEVKLAPLGSQFDQQIMAGVAAGRGVEFLFGWALRLVKDLRFVIVGRLAAAIQGAPLSDLAAAEIALHRADVDAFAERMSLVNCLRWDDHIDDWGYRRRDPREPGPLRWLAGRSELRLKLVDDLPLALTVVTDEGTLPVVPLCDLEADDPTLRRFMDRYRDRQKVGRV